MSYYLAKHTLSALLGWGPSYKLVVLDYRAHRGLDQVRWGKLMVGEAHGVSSTCEFFNVAARCAVCFAACISYQLSMSCSHTNINAMLALSVAIH